MASVPTLTPNMPEALGEGCSTLGGTMKTMCRHCCPFPSNQPARQNHKNGTRIRLAPIDRFGEYIPLPLSSTPCLAPITSKARAACSSWTTDNRFFLVAGGERGTPIERPTAQAIPGVWVTAGVRVVLVVTPTSPAAPSPKQSPACLLQRLYTLCWLWA